jgi:hypothetical protein
VKDRSALALDTTAPAMARINAELARNILDFFILGLLFDIKKQ